MLWRVPLITTETRMKGEIIAKVDSKEVTTQHHKLIANADKNGAEVGLTM